MELSTNEDLNANARPYSGMHSAVNSPLVQEPISPLPREGVWWLGIVGLIFITALFKAINLLLLLSFFLIGVWLVNWFIVRRISKHLRGVRLISEPIFAGKPSFWEVEIEHDEPRPAEGWVIDDVGPDHAIEWFILRIDRGQPIRLTGTVQIAERGRYVCEPLRAWTRFPFGLFHRTIELTKADEKIVLPNPLPIHGQRFRQWLMKSTRGDGAMRQRIRHFSTLEADVHGLRTYRPGDSPRWIHWRTSARRGELMIREFEDNAPPHLVLVIEPFLSYSDDAMGKTRLERAIRIGASIVKEWCQQEDAQFTMILAGPEPRIFKEVRGSDRTLRMLEELAIEPGGPVCDPNQWFTSLHRLSTLLMLVISSRSSQQLASVVSHHLGRPVAKVEVDETIPWLED